METLGFDSVVEMDRPDCNPDGTFYAWGTSDDRRHVLWTFDFTSPPGSQQRLVVFEPGS
jgi:hypothetical protein